MQIQRLTVQNFRCFVDETWEFTPRLNLIVGDGGTGKTALLDALAIAIAPLLASPESDWNSGRLRGQDFRWEERGQGAAKGREACFPLRARVDATFQGAGVTSGIEHQPPHAVGMGGLIFFRANARREPLEPLLPALALDPSATLPLLLYRTCEQSEPVVEALLPEEPEAAEPSRLDIYRTWRSPAFPTQAVAEWFGEQERRARRAGSAARLLQGVCEAILPCLPSGCSLRYDHREADLVVEYPDRPGAPRGLLRPRRSSPAVIAAILACRCALLNPHLLADASKETAGLVLIDDVERQLSPGREGELAALCQSFPRLQFVIASSSARLRHSLASIGGDSLIDLNDPEYGSAQPSPPSSSHSSSSSPRAVR